MMSSTSGAAADGWADRHAITPDERASVLVVEAISAAANTAVERLPILYEVIDPDALDALFAARPDGAGPFEGRISFAYAGYRVTIDDGTITVRPTAE